MTADLAAQIALTREANAAFTQAFGQPATLAAYSPGRVNFIGEHTDYTDGLAMPFAIDRYVSVVARPRGHNANATRLCSTMNNQEITIGQDAASLQPVDDWSTYVRGVLSGLASVDIRPPALDILVHSNLPSGAGLSSSAALEVACIYLFLAAADTTLPAEKIMQLAQRAEHDFANVPCGMLDQFSVVNGQQNQMLLFDSRSLTGEPIPMAGDDLCFLVIDSKVSHALTDGAYAQRRSELDMVESAVGKSLRDTDLDEVESATDDPTLRVRAKHVINENARVLSMQRALASADWKTVGGLLYDGHASLRDDFEVSCSETDIIVALASRLAARGVIGARMTGGGFGGSVIALVHQSGAADIATTISDQYYQSTGIRTTPLVVTPSQGAAALPKRLWA